MRWREGLEMKARNGRLTHVRVTSSPIDDDADDGIGCLGVAVLVVILTAVIWIAA